MPNYEYECTQCGKTFSVQQSVNEHQRGKKVKCPKCESKKVEQVITPVYAKTSKKS